MNYLNLVVKEVINETPDTITIVFNRPAGVNFHAGQFLTLIIDINGQEVRRSYSLCSAPYEMERLAVSVKRVDNGLMSNYLPNNVKAGDTIKVMEPMGTFKLEPNNANANHYLLFAGGSGITPIMSILKVVMRDEPHSTVTLIFANRDEASITFRKELDEIKTAQGDRLKIVHVLEDHSAEWSGKSGRITAEVIKEAVTPSSITSMYMCGPAGMMDAIESAVNVIEMKQPLYKESFVAATTSTEYSSGVGTKVVKIIYDGDEYQVEVEEGESILDAALDDDIDLPYSCQGGVCTACRGKCLSGKVDLTEVEGLSDAEMKQGYVLTCVGHPLTDDVVVEIG